MVSCLVKPIGCCIILLRLITSHITRLPGCKYYGNFKIQRDSYFEGSEIGKILHDLSLKNCTGACIADNSCVFLNYDISGNECQLLTSFSGSIVQKDGWSFLSTNYSNPFTIGPNCATYEPCPWCMYCYDSCNNNGYECVPPVGNNVAQEGKVTVSSLYTTDRPASAVIDGDIATRTTTKKAKNAWVKLKLTKIYTVKILCVYISFNVRFVGCKVQVSKFDGGYKTVAVVGEKREIVIWLNEDIQYVYVGRCLLEDHLNVSEIKATI